MADQAIDHKVPIDKSYIQGLIDKSEVKYPDTFPTFHDSLSSFERSLNSFLLSRQVYGGNLE